MAAKRGSKTTKIGDKKGISAGRPKGAKNKTTLMKEVMREGFEDTLMKEGIRVLETVIEKAKEGDLAACKLVLDRIYPVTKAVDIDAVKASAVKGIVINIEKLVATNNKTGETIEDGVVIDEN